MHHAAPNAVHGVWPWAALLLLGAAHGVNPGMGWLFAVGLGVQRRERSAVWRALAPLAAGHAAAIAVVAVVVGVVGLAIPLGEVRWLVAIVLFGLGVTKLVRTRHPRFGGMTVGSRDIAVWSFLMASAHGAGLMVAPFMLGDVRPAAGMWVSLVHTAGYLLVTALVAVIVYERLGLRLLGKAWFNVDRLWAGALIATASLTPFLA